MVDKKKNDAATKRHKALSRKFWIVFWTMKVIILTILVFFFYIALKKFGYL